jgi:hypothetical protein
MAHGQVWRITGLVSGFTTSDAKAPGYRLLVRYASDYAQLTPPAGAPAPQPTGGGWPMLHAHRRFNPLKGE